MVDKKSINFDELKGEKITVKLKSDREIKGTLTKYDDYMNLVLKNVEEYKHGEFVTDHDLVVVKGGNVLGLTV